MKQENIDAEELLGALRWKADMFVTNPFGERVWLKECFQGKEQIGITECCIEEEPCEWHTALKSSRDRVSND